MKTPYKLGAAVVCSAVLAFPSTALADTKTYALVIGNNEPPPGSDGAGLNSLRYADDDAVRYAELLGQVADDVRLVTVLDSQTRRRFADLRPAAPPRLAAVKRELRELTERAAEDRSAGHEVIFYVVFSGHGAVRKNGEAVLALLDTSLTREMLFDDILAPIDADAVHLILDACHAAGVVGVRGHRGFGKEVDADTAEVSRAEANGWVERRTLARFPHVGVLAATTAGEQAHEWSEIESGVFSHEVLSALWGAGDVNGDLAIEYTEVQAFVSAANRSLDDPKAAPKVVARPPATDPHAPLVDLGSMRSATWVSGNASRLGHFTIELADGRRHLDANTRASALTFALPAGTAAYLRTKDREAEIDPSHSRQSLAALQFAPPTEGSRGSTAAAYRRKLFAEPYTVDYYRGYVDSIDAIPVRFDAKPVSLSPPPSPAPRTTTPPPARLSGASNVRLDDADKPPTFDRDRARRNAGITLAALAGGATVATIVTGALAAQARSEFNSTDIESEANAANERYRRYLIGTVTSAVITGVLTAIAVPLILRNKKNAKKKR